MVVISIDLQIILCLVLLLTQNLKAESKVMCLNNERDALLEFKNGLSDPSNKLKSWVGEDCCSWLGISCNSTNGHVTKLELSGIGSGFLDENECQDSCLGGELSKSLINLAELSYLHLSVNNFSEIPVPGFLGSFRMLEYLNFSGAKFVGNVPRYIGNISSLKYFDLSYNSELKFDSLSFVSGLTSLEFLDLSGLNLSAADDWIPSLKRLSSLTELHLSSCSLESLSDFVSANFTSLAVLDLTRNQLQGSLPREFGSLKSLEILRLQDNDFEGELPDSLAKLLCNLQELDLSKNSFTGEIMGILDNLASGCVSPRLKVLDLSNNNFRGVMPDSLGSFTRLEYVSLYRNSFSGRIPETIGRLKYLREFSVFNNLFNGSIPKSIGQLSKLEILDLNSNKLDGKVSEVHFSRLESLTRLSLYGNLLIFDINSTWLPPFRQLESVYLASCRLGPEFPQWLRVLTNNSLQLLDLYNTSISGGIPGWFQNISANIQWLDLSHNQIEKNFPIFGKPSSPVFTRVVYLNSNKFEGPLTALPGDMEVLDVSNNLVSGQIPQKVSELMPKLSFLSLSNNNLSGGIPLSLCNLTDLTYLDLSKNQLFGEIPQCWTKMPFLNVFDLAYNNFSGRIPDSLGSLRNLGALHLERNKLEGNIPTSLRNLTNLLTLDLSENVITGTFPYWIDQNFSSLAVLSLHSNSLKGEIPMQLCGITSLRILNLANNVMTGNIPSCFDNFTAMIVEDPDFDNYWLSSFSFPVLFQTPGRYNAYQDHVLTYIKGREFEYTKTIQFLISIDLSENNFYGKIPKEISNLKLVKNLNLSRNNFTGNIPSDIGNMKALKYLREFSVFNNLFNGSIPESIGQLSKLEILDLNSNKLEDKVSEVHFSRLESLTRLSLYGNLLIFDINSTWLPPFHQLESVYLDSCRLGPEFPQWLRVLTNNSLQLLDLYNTSISGGIPGWFQNMSANIQWLDLSHNQIEKNFPIFGKPTSPVFTRVVYLNSNKFEGPLTALPRDVELLDVSNNLVSGQIPQKVSEMMPKLSFFSLSNNNLSGGIPLSLCNLTDLTYLDLSKNQLSGEIPQCWTEMPFLNVFDLAYNNLSGRIPDSLGSLRYLGALHLERNKLEGNIPTSLRNLTNLLTLDLSENVITGTFPYWIDENFSSLAVLSLHSNSLKGEIPMQLCGITSLRILNLANNVMTGNIPSCFDNFTSMIVEDPEFVNYWLLSFSFPVLFQTPDRYNAYQDHVLTYIKGREFEYTKTIQFLISIDLSENNFYGKIPKEISNLKLVKNLNLSRNNFTGNIPSDIGNMKALESLDLSWNELLGSIPPSISALNFLSYMNLSFNNLSGPIPHGNQLRTLDDESFYIGNDGLCGFPLQGCNEEPKLHKPAEPDGQDEFEWRWFYFGLVAGFVTGSVVVCDSLYFESSWRRAFFRLVDEIYDKLYVTIVVKMNKLKRNSEQI